MVWEVAHGYMVWEVAHGYRVWEVAQEIIPYYIELSISFIIILLKPEED
jgi:hypothetical protein